MPTETKYQRQKRWRLGHTAYRNKERGTYYRKHSINKLKSMSRWTTEDIDMVLRHTMPDVELSEQIHRSVQAIQVLRARIKKERGTYGL